MFVAEAIDVRTGEMIAGTDAKIGVSKADALASIEPGGAATCCRLPNYVVAVVRCG